MAALIPWFERKFSFDFPVEIYPDVIERFRGAPARVEERVRGVPREVLVRREREGTWSIQENVGHLLDLEALWERRLEDFLAGKTDLAVADLTNRATHEAGHNDREIGEILAAFRERRMRQVAVLEGLGAEEFGRVAVHPRLKQPMRLVDAVTFVCAHDDYHLARIGELLRLFGAAS
jgi:uncharacterized damage-inducible protein DinB